MRLEALELHHPWVLFLLVPALAIIAWRHGLLGPLSRGRGSSRGSASRSAPPAIVFPTERPPYVLVILTRGFTDTAAADRYIAQESRQVWEALGALAHSSPVR